MTAVTSLFGFVRLHCCLNTRAHTHEEYLVESESVYLNTNMVRALVYLLTYLHGADPQAAVPCRHAPLLELCK